MPNVKIRHRETLLDVAVLQAGNISGVFELALLNNVSITKDFASGEELMTGAIVNQDVVTELKSRNAKPARGISIVPGQQNEGIGFWKVFVDFVVQ